MHQNHACQPNHAHSSLSVSEPQQFHLESNGPMIDVLSPLAEATSATDCWTEPMAHPLPRRLQERILERASKHLGCSVPALLHSLVWLAKTASHDGNPS